MAALTHNILPVHPRTGLQAIGWVRDRPVWPVMGAEDSTGEPAGDGGPTVSATGGEAGSGEAGDDFGKLKSALDKERAARRDAEKRAKDHDTVKAELDKLRADGMSDQEKAIDAARKEAGDAARAEVLRDRVLDKIEVAAAGKFADVEDAALHLGRRAEEFIGKDGLIDAKSIGAAVEKLLADKPHLAAGSTKPPSFDGGHRTTDDKPSVASGAARYTEHNKRKTA